LIDSTKLKDIMSDVALLPPKSDVETRAVLRKTAEAHRFLAELKGIAASLTR
jgi:hypothetical protein